MTALGTGAPNVWTLSISCLSLAVAVYSVVISRGSIRTARRALELSEAQESRRSPRLDIKVKDAVSLRASQRWIYLDVQIVNPTDRDGSIVDINLHVTYLMTGGTAVVVKVPAAARFNVPGYDQALLSAPLKIPANDARAGRLAFMIDASLTGGGQIDDFAVVIHDSRGLVETVQFWAPREVT